jgi:hypothetical protein
MVFLLACGAAFSQPLPPADDGARFWSRLRRRLQLLLLGLALLAAAVLAVLLVWLSLRALSLN